MGKTEHALDIMHEAGILCCMLLFVISGAMLMLRYANDGDALPLIGGGAAMAVGASVLLRTPGRFRKWHGVWDARRNGAAVAEVEDENELYDEEIVRVRGG